MCEKKRRFGCFFSHNWGKWKEVSRKNFLFTHKPEAGIQHIVLTQDRVCLDCGKIEIDISTIFR